MTYSDEFLKMKAEAIEHSIGKPSRQQLKRLPSGELLKVAIIRLRADGKTFTAIRAELGCSLCTINYHLADVKEKSDLRLRKHLAVKKAMKAAKKAAKAVHAAAVPKVEKVKPGKPVKQKEKRSAPLPVDFKPKTDMQKKFKTKIILPGQKVRVQINHKTWIEIDSTKDVDKIVAKYEKALNYDRDFKRGRF